MLFFSGRLLINGLMDGIIALYFVSSILISYKILTTKKVYILREFFEKPDPQIIDFPLGNRISGFKIVNFFRLRRANDSPPNPLFFFRLRQNVPFWYISILSRLCTVNTILINATHGSVLTVGNCSDNHLRV